MTSKGDMRSLPIKFFIAYFDDQTLSILYQLNLTFCLISITIHITLALFQNYDQKAFLFTLKYQDFLKVLSKKRYLEYYNSARFCTRWTTRGENTLKYILFLSFCFLYFSSHGDDPAIHKDTMIISTFKDFFTSCMLKKPSDYCDTKKRTECAAITNCDARKIQEFSRIFIKCTKCIQLGVIIRLIKVCINDFVYRPSQPIISILSQFHLLLSYSFHNGDLGLLTV